MDSYEKLLKRRDLLIDRMNKVQDSISKFKQGDDLSKLKINVKFLEKYYDMYDTLTMEIELSEEIPSNKRNSTIFELDKKVETTYRQTIARAQRILQNVIIENFSGEIEDWPSFCYQFEKIIHKNDTMTPSQKLYQLRICMKGGKGYEYFQELHTGNYNETWERIKICYNNNSIQQDLLKISEFKKITNSQTELRSFLDNVLEIIDRVRAKDVESKWEWLILREIQLKLDEETINQWNKMIETEHHLQPTLRNMIRFLSIHCETIEFAIEGVTQLTKL